MLNDAVIKKCESEDSHFHSLLNFNQLSARNSKALPSERYAARLTHRFMLELLEIGDADYIEKIRNEVEEFRKVFVEWVATFDRSNNMGDEWGIWTEEYL